MRHPPYHLRTNKAIDRLLLVEVLRVLVRNPLTVKYYSLAGPFLEDLRIMDHFFPGIRLFSLEKSDETFKRQSFHQFSRGISLRNKQLRDFLLHDYRPGRRDVFWLDYTDLRYPRFEEFQVVLKKVPIGSVVRITLRAEPELDLEPLVDKISEQQLSSIRQQMEQAFSDEFSAVLPHPPGSSFSSPSQFARMVQSMVKRAASTALDLPGSNRDFVHVHSTRYRDRNQMVSVTGVVCDRTKIKATHHKLRHLRFVNFGWLEPLEINVPVLSVKERLHLETHLPVGSDENVGRKLSDALGYLIDRTRAASERRLAQYAEHHRDYPNFARIVI